MKIFKSNRAHSVWGSSQPTQLQEIANYLTLAGFEGPTQASTIYSLEFVRKIDADLKFTCSIDRVYEDPHGVFNFQTYLGLSSLVLRVDVDAARIWETPICDVKDKSVGIFSIGLQHLKWNAEGGDINPVWQVSALPHYASSAMMMVRNQQVEDAKALLMKALNVNTREEKRLQLQLALDWIQENKPPRLH